MFESTKMYWVKLRTKNGEISFKGKVIEETPLLIKFQLRNGQIEIIPIVRIIDVNEAREDVCPATKVEEVK